MLLLVLWWCCWCWWAFRGWWGLRSALYHPPGSSFWAYRSPQSEGQEPKTAPFICQNDNHWQWWPSYLTQGRLQRQFVPLWPAVGRTLLCNFKEGWTKSGLGEGRGRGSLERDSVMERCGYWDWQVKRRKKKKNTRSLSFSHQTQQASSAACQRGSDVNNVAHDVVLEATQEVDMHQVTWNHRRFLTISCSSSCSD